MDSNLAFQEAAREELLDGRLVAMSPASSNHNRIAGNIFSLFHHYLKGKTCEPFGDGEALYLTGKDHVVPDFMIVCDPDKIKWNGVYGAPDLVVEILSPSTAKNDRGYKKDLYERCGVREYWIISPKDRTVEQYLLSEERFSLHTVCTLYADYELEAMTQQERAAVITEIRCSLYSDLTLQLDDLFYRTI